MNERIRQLAEQCESFGSWDNKIYSFDKEKFAELIVKECMEWCDAHATINGTAQQVRDSIKQHFGVEDIDTQLRNRSTYFGNDL
jgi:hypothetical protein